jgi:hypothetical protein
MPCPRARPQKHIQEQQQDGFYFLMPSEVVLIGSEFNQGSLSSTRNPTAKHTHKPTDAAKARGEMKW